MKTTKVPVVITPTPPARKSRPVPPPPRWYGESAVLSLSQEAFAICLWRTLRDVFLWVSGPSSDGVLAEPCERARARWKAARKQVPEVGDALQELQNLREALVCGRWREVADACDSIAMWADAADQPELAVTFAEAAARLDSDDAGRSNSAGLRARRALFSERASVWYHRAYELARNDGDVRESIRALLGFGNTLYHLGRYDQADVVLTRASRSAKRNGQRRQAAEAEHDLLLTAVEIGTYSEGERHSLRALQWYPITHPRLPALVHDIGYFLSRSGLFEDALRLLTMAQPHIQREAEKTVVWSNVGRAAAGCGEIERYDAARRQVLAVADREAVGLAESLWSIADGAYLLGRVDDARMIAERALEAARAEMAAGAERRSRSLLTRLDSRAPAPPPAAAPRYSRTMEIQDWCATKLARWRDAPAWLRRRFAASR